MAAQPTVEQLREIARIYGMHLSDADLEASGKLVGDQGRGNPRNLYCKGNNERVYPFGVLHEDEPAGGNESEECHKAQHQNIVNRWLILRGKQRLQCDGNAGESSTDSHGNQCQT